MKQYGDIRELNGADLDPVDLIVGGSPCQDLSVARSNRAGLSGERSGLFLEMIRIIKEMRNATDPIRPHWILWENVPGAVGSGDPRGADFSTLLGEFSRIIEPDAPDVPIPSEGWRNAGVLLVGSRGSLAWRITDAQYWGKTIRDSSTGDVLQMGTPQRRRRIALVADLGGHSAPEILFEPFGSQGDPLAEPEQREGYAECSENSTGNTGEPIMIEMTSTKNTIVKDGISPTLTARMGTGGNQVNAVLDNVNGVRRLTPKEIERLQGFPDDWTNIPGASDSKRYRALGNSICLPWWAHLARRFAQYGNVKTIGSLFDGIGGFPLVFRWAGIKTLWTSEIEPFCQKVVAIRFGEDE